MRRSDRDLLRTPPHQLDRLSQDELLRLVVICRDKQSTAKLAKDAWMALVASDIDRVRGILASHGAGRDELDELAQIAYERCVKMFATFRGDSEGEYRSAMRTCIGYVYKDWVAGRVGHRRRVKGSLDENYVDDEGEGRGRFEADVARKETERIREEEAAKAARERRRRVIDAVTRIPNERRRLAVQLSFEGRPVAEIQSRLNVSRDNVYQLRARGLKDLQLILDGDDSSLNGQEPDDDDE